MSRTSASKAMATIAGIGAMALVITACGSSTTATTSTPSSSNAAASSSDTASASSSAASGSDTGSASASASGTASASASDSATGSSSAGGGDAALNDDATYCDVIKKNWPDITGKSVGVYAGITSTEGDLLNKSFADFQTCTGATVKYTADKGFEQQVVVQAKSGNPPDIGVVPQPGLLATLVSTGKVAKAPDLVAANVDKYWDKAWKGYGTVNGTFYAAPMRASVKSLVWYSPKMFKAKGYQVPTTWDDMIKLSDTIAATGEKPWCAGIESGTATGWPTTDWLEEVVLRQAGPDVYDQWIKHDVKFADAPIAKALATVGTVLKNDKYVNGGIGDVSSIAKTAFAEGGLPIQSGKCYMHAQASFYAANWKNNPDISENGDIYAFYEPTMGDAFGKPVEVGGEFVTAFNNRPEVQAFQYFMTTSHWANEQAKISPQISANKGLRIENVKSPINQLSVKILQDPKSVSRFDASDLMPAAVGSGAEWQQLTAWITGQDDKTTLSSIDAAWPAS